MWSLPLICDLVKSLGALQMVFSHWSHLSFDPWLGGHFFLEANKPHQEVNNEAILAKKNPVSILQIMTVKGVILILILCIYLMLFFFK